MANAFLVRPVPFVSAVAYTTTGAGDPAFVGNDYYGLIWQSADGNNASIRFDLGADVAVDTIAILGLVTAAAPATVWTIKLGTAAQGPGLSGSNTTTGTGTNNYWLGQQGLFAGGAIVACGQHRSPAPGAALWTAPASAGPPAVTRYIELNFGGMTATGLAGWVRLGRVSIGKRVQPSRNFSYGAAKGVRDFGAFDFSARGVMLRRRSTHLRTTAIGFQSLYKDEVEGAIEPLLEMVGGTDPVTLVVDPTNEASLPRRMFHGPLLGDLGTVRRNAVGFSAAISMVSLF